MQKKKKKIEQLHISSILGRVCFAKILHEKSLEKLHLRCLIEFENTPLSIDFLLLFKSFVTEIPIT